MCRHFFFTAPVCVAFLWAHWSCADVEPGDGHGFAYSVLSFSPGECAGFGQDRYPEIVVGPPVGGGHYAGGTDVLSLGTGGEIVFDFTAKPILNKEGLDFIVFENVFFAAGENGAAYIELAEVSVSTDGHIWHAFKCDKNVAKVDESDGQCAGQKPVYSAPDNNISPFEPQMAGGDAYDLETLKIDEVRYLRIRDMGSQRCRPGIVTNGFDLDAIAVLHQPKD